MNICNSAGGWLIDFRASAFLLIGKRLADFETLGFAPTWNGSQFIPSPFDLDVNYNNELELNFS